MARDFGKVRVAFWADNKVSTWPERLKFIALYLLTSPHTNAIGCFRLPLQYMAADTGLPADQAKEALEGLAKQGWLKWCPTTNYIFICNFLEHNGIENGKVGTHCINLAKALPRSIWFLADVETALKAALLANDIEWKGFGYPIDTLSEPNRTPEPEPEPIRTHATHETASPSLPGKISQSPMDLKKELFVRGVSYLTSCGLDEPKARSMLGKWRKERGDTAVVMAMASAEAAAVSAPIPYIEAILRGKNNGKSTGQPSGDAHPLGFFGKLADRLREVERGDGRATYASAS